jgi:hypothetical protein
MEHQLDATITVLFISKISSTCFGQTFAHLQERKTEIVYLVCSNGISYPSICDQYRCESSHQERSMCTN